MDKEHLIQALIDDGRSREKAYEVYRFYEMQGKLKDLEQFFITQECLATTL